MDRAGQRRDRGVALLPLVVVAAVSLVAGSVVGTVAARSDASEPPVSPFGEYGRSRIPVYDCPGGRQIGTAGSGDRIVLTGIFEGDDGWLRTRDPESPWTVWWIAADAVDPDAELDDLEPATCVDEGELVALDDLLDEEPVDDEVDEAEGVDEPAPADDPTPPTTAPGPPTTVAPGQPAPPTTQPATTTSTSTTTTSTTTTTTTTSTTTTTTTPVAPTFGGVNRSAPAIRENFNGSCDTALPTTSTLSTSVSHPSGIASVEFRRRIGNGPWGGWQQVSSSGGAVSGQIGPYPADTIGVDQTVSVSWEFRATSTAGTTAVRSSTANERVDLSWCSLG
jgi:hypothetical protein